MPTIDLTQREKAVVDALRLLDGEEHNREQNFMRIVSEYRARVEGLEVLLERVTEQLVARLGTNSSEWATVREVRQTLTH